MKPVRVALAAVLGAAAAFLVIWGGYSVIVSDRRQVEGGGYGVVLIGAGLVVGLNAWVALLMRER